VTALAPGPRSVDWRSGLRELVAGALAASVAGVTLFMLVRVFRSAGEPLSPEAYARQKDLMLYGLALLGTVMGYYFGRIPAERRAEHAEAAAEEARAQAAETAAAVAREAARVARAQHERALAAPAHPAPGGGPAR
jgi:type II secretory pathway component PulM